MADKISITICGEGGCGKSSITLRLVKSQWTSEYDPTIEDCYSVTRTIDGRPYYLSITDTAGQEEYRSMWAASNLNSDAFLLVYDITQEDTLHALTQYAEMIDIETDHRIEENATLIRERGSMMTERDRQRIKAMPVKIVAGNKCDLREERQITSRVGLDWARRRGCGFMETSAREMVNIEESFALIIRRVLEARQHAQLHPTDTYTSTPRINFSSPTLPNLSSVMNPTQENQNPTTSSPTGPSKKKFGKFAGTTSTNATAALGPPSADEKTMYKKGSGLGSAGWPVDEQPLPKRLLAWLKRWRCW